MKKLKWNRDICFVGDKCFVNNEYLQTVKEFDNDVVIEKSESIKREMNK